MINVNLLPIDMRKVEVKRTGFPIQTVLIVSIFILLVFSVFQFFSYLNVKVKSHKLNAEISKLKDASKQADELSQKITTKILPDKTFFYGYILPRVLLSELMSEVSASIPDSIWLADLKFRRDKELLFFELNGNSRITSKQIAVAQIQEYINSVRMKLEELVNESNPDALQEVKVTLTTNLRDVAGVEAMQFVATFQSSAQKANAPAAKA